MGHRLLAVVLVAVVGVALAAGGAAPAASQSNNTTQLAPGLTADGVTDAFALAQAHQRTLKNTSYTLTDTTTVEYRNGTLLGQWANTERVAADGATFSRANVGTFRNGSGSLALVRYERGVWSNGSVTLSLIQYPDRQPRYDRRDGPTGSTLSPDTQWETLYVVFEAVNTTVTGQVERNGTTLYRVVGTGVEPDSAHAGDVPFNLVALVDERGVVHSLQYSHPTTYQNEPAVVTQTIRVTAVGNTTVERPAWTDRALANTTGGAAGNATVASAP